MAVLDIQPEEKESQTSNTGLPLGGPDTADTDTQTAAELPISTKQKQCPEISAMYTYLETGKVPDDPVRAKAIVFESEMYDIVDGILSHFGRPSPKRQSLEMGEVAQVVLPRVDRQAAMRALHDDNDHFGIKTTTALIKSKYFRHRMFRDITDFVKSCDRCQRAKRNTPTPHLPLHPLPIAGVFGRLHMDIIGIVCKSSEGHEYILVVVDSFSRWVEAWPLKTQTSAEIARLLHEEVFCRYGAAIEIISDKGRNFLSKLVNAVCEIYQVTRHSTSS